MGTQINNGKEIGLRELELGAYLLNKKQLRKHKTKMREVIEHEIKEITRFQLCDDDVVQQSHCVQEYEGVM